MPFSNLTENHISDETIALLTAALAQVETIIAGFTQNLSAQERRRYGRINEQHKLFTNKVNDYHQTNPELQSPDVDWVEFEKDYKDRQVLEAQILRLKSILKMATDAKILHDYDNYQNALVDYRYAKFKTRTSGGSQYSVKFDELKQFFPRG